MRASICVWAVAWALWLVVGVVEGRARLVENGYEGVVVALSQELEEEQGPALIEALRVGCQRAYCVIFVVVGYGLICCCDCYLKVTDFSTAFLA